MLRQKLISMPGARNRRMAIDLALFRRYQVGDHCSAGIIASLASDGGRFHRNTDPVAKLNNTQQRLDPSAQKKRRESVHR